ncbi:MAG: hypothetical protein BGO98_20865 [Myxococcales bacterium 68-20]|nr:MAG: hypothetical protein BGO98_20865 [Myxococcales bacterium 68-20]
MSGAVRARDHRERTEELSVALARARAVEYDAVMKSVLPRSFTVAVILAALGSGACSRKEAASGAADAGTDAALVSMAADAAPAPSASAMQAASFPDAGFALAKVTPTEARRVRVAKLDGDPALSGAKAILEGHFAGVPGPFDVQTGALTAAGRRVVLVAEAGKPTSDARPIAFVLDDADRLVWSKEHPIAGIVAPVGPIAIAPGPRGRVALAACDPPTKLVALRLWDDDGSPFADFEAISGVESCDALSLLYWPGKGWIVVAAGVGATRARLLEEKGTPAWGDGLDLGVRSRPGAIAAPSLAADTDETFVLVQMAQPSAAPGSPFHALAFRYDTRGAPIWKAAADLGPLPKPPSAGERVKLGLTRPGVRVTLPSGTEVDVRPSGDVIARPRAPR